MQYPHIDDSGTFAASIIQCHGHGHGHDSTRLIENLITLQYKYGHVPPPAISKLSNLLNIPSMQISGVVEFYSRMFRLSYVTVG